MVPTRPQFDGFEEVALPDVEEEDEPPKIPTASKSKRRKEIGVQNHDKVLGVVGHHPLVTNQALSFLSVSLAGCGVRPLGPQAVASGCRARGMGWSRGGVQLLKRPPHGRPIRRMLPLSSLVRSGLSCPWVLTPSFPFV